MNPKVLNLYHLPGKQIPVGAVYIGRPSRTQPSRWGNPFEIGRDGTREQVIEKYKAWLLTQPELMAAAKRELAGHDLVCFCAPKACHGDTLLALVNQPIAMTPAIRGA